MSAVLDASAAVAVVMNRDADGRIAAVLREADVVRSPDIFVAELTNTFWKYARMGGMDADRCLAALDRAIGLTDVIAPASGLFEEAFDLARRLDHPAYDLFYVVLARRHASVLLTADRDVASLCRKLRVRTV